MAVIKDLDKGAGEVIRIEVSEYKGQKYLNVRIWYTDKSSGELKPTQKGVAIKPDHYQEFLAAVTSAGAELR